MTDLSTRDGQSLDLARDLLTNTTQLIDGAWVHTRSRIRHLGAVAPGATVVVESWEIDRFDTRSGERAVVDMRMTVDDRVVCAVEHEAIVRLHAREA